ncbi:MAG: hypothetical protein ABSE46_07730 [Terracidiphilus sp.]|jgi:hypothetical protein
MLPRISRISLLIVCLSFASVLATAQQVVHALVGTVNAINPNAKTIVITTDDGTKGSFDDLTDSKAHISLDKALRADTTPALSFTAKDTSAIVLFYGEGADRTAVALRDIGVGPFTKSAGVVVNFSGKDHSFSVKDDAGNVEVFKLAPETVAETRSGAVDGKKFEPGKGEQVRVTSGLVNGSPTALFVYAN